MRLARGAKVDARNERRVLRIDFDEMLLLKLHQRVAHRRLAHAKLALQQLARQHCVRDKLQRQDAFAQCLVNLRRSLTRSVELAGQALDLDVHRIPVEMSLPV